MSSNLRIPRIVLLLFVLTNFGCVEDKEYSESTNLRPEVNRNVDVADNTNLAEDNENKLDSLINLPFQPLENTFREEALADLAGNSRVPGPNDRRLTVVLKFSSEDTANIIKEASEENPPFKTEIEAPSWFPAELIAKSSTTGNEQLNGTGYSAKQFVKAPWLNGSLVRVDDTDYFVLLLQTT